MKDLPVLDRKEIVMHTRAIYWYATVLPIKRLRFLRERLSLALTMVDNLIADRTKLKVVGGRVMNTVIVLGALCAFLLGNWWGWLNCKKYEATKRDWRDDEIKLLKNSLHEIVSKTGGKK